MTREETEKLFVSMDDLNKRLSRLEVDISKLSGDFISIVELYDKNFANMNSSIAALYRKVNGR